MANPREMRGSGGVQINTVMPPFPSHIMNRVELVVVVQVFGMGLAIGNFVRGRMPNGANFTLACVAVLGVVGTAILVYNGILLRRYRRELVAAWDKHKGEIKGELQTLYPDNPVQVARIMQQMEEGFK